MHCGCLTRDARRVLNTKEDPGASHTELVLIQHFRWQAAPGSPLSRFFVSLSSRETRQLGDSRNTASVITMSGALSATFGDTGFDFWQASRTFAVPLCSGTRPRQKFWLSQTKTKLFFSLSQCWPLPKGWNSCFFLLFFLFHCCTIPQSLFSLYLIIFVFSLPLFYIPFRTSPGAPRSGI